MAAPFAAWLILNNHDTAALLVFAAAGLSDGLDGFIARRWHVTSGFGAWLDPAADKLLMLLCFTALLWVGATPFWLVALVVARDAAIAAGWLLDQGTGPARRHRGRCSWARLRPSCRSSTFFAVLLLLAFDLDAPRSGAGGGLGLRRLFVVLSAAAYAALFLRSLFAGRPFAS